uniref:Uncharacterized protein n=1 Tax=Plectus sambesii TaxID=2011161 RepID=A0A914XJ79_9BILA
MDGDDAGFTEAAVGQSSYFLRHLVTTRAREATDESGALGSFATEDAAASMSIGANLPSTLHLLRQWAHWSLLCFPSPLRSFNGAHTGMAWMVPSASVAKSYDRRGWALGGRYPCRSNDVAGVVGRSGWIVGHAGLHLLLPGLAASTSLGLVRSRRTNDVMRPCMRRRSRRRSSSRQCTTGRRAVGGARRGWRRGWRPRHVRQIYGPQRSAPSSSVASCDLWVGLAAIRRYSAGGSSE